MSRILRRRIVYLAAGIALLTSVAVAVAVVFRDRGETAVGTLQTSATLLRTPGLPWFVDVAAERGIDFLHYDSATPTHYIQETMGSGVAWIDFDGDGWPDLFCVQDGPIRPDGKPAPMHKLYRNNGDGTFLDVSAAVGRDKSGYGIGVAAGAVDN